MRGEHLSSERKVTDSLGSSPHARGAPMGDFAHVWPSGIIPACAGSTCPTGRRRRGTGDHPHMRGEHSGSPSQAPCTAGSSPHARGAHRLAPMGAERRGIIPACAGSTAFYLRKRCVRRDHPRMRGEHTPSSVTLGRAMGSSPHARGARSARVRDCRRVGIIPACAGSTAPPNSLGTLQYDHPRMRGEHGLTEHVFCVHVGSSPHARGALLRPLAYNLHCGIIPACAGSTPVVKNYFLSIGDHPRMRGEH